jgi:hypothetical protein
LITNNPDKINDLQQFGISVVERVAIETTVYPENVAYLLTKAQRMNHLLDPISLAGVLVGSLSLPAKVSGYNHPAGVNGQNNRNGNGTRGNYNGHNGYQGYNGSSVH